MSPATALLVNFIVNCLLVIATPMAGLLGDYVCLHCTENEEGFRVVMIIGILLMLCFALPCFVLINTRDMWATLLGELFLVIPLALFAANAPAFMVRMFDVRVRYSAVALSYNLSHAVFSSTAALVQTWGVTAFARRSSSSPSGNTISAYAVINDSRYFPVCYLYAICILSLCAMTIGLWYCEDRPWYKSSLAKECCGVKPHPDVITT